MTSAASIRARMPKTCQDYPSPSASHQCKPNTSEHRQTTDAPSSFILIAESPNSREPHHPLHIPALQHRGELPTRVDTSAVVCRAGPRMRGRRELYTYGGAAFPVGGQ